MAHDAHHDEVHDDAAAGPHVLSVSPENPHVRTVVLDRETMGAERTFLPAIVKGLGITARRFFVNVFARKETATIEYPEVKPPYTERFRGVHRLMTRDDGTVRCVACMLCPTVCPAHCITIIPTERPDSNEKMPAVFEIDELRCVVCGLCVEACPCDAIRMDTGIHMNPVKFRGDAILDKPAMMSRGAASTAKQGGYGKDWDEKDAHPDERGARSKIPATPR